MEKSKENQSFYQKWWFWVIVAFIIIGCIGYAQNPDNHNYSASSNQDHINSSQSQEIENKPEAAKIANGTTEYGLGEPLEHDGYEVVFGSEYKREVITNQFSDNYGGTVIGIPMTETNNNDGPGSLNNFDLTIFSPAGNELSWSVGALFDDSNIKAGDILPGGSQTSYVYFLYDGPGEYQIYIGGYQSYNKNKTVVKAEID